MFPVLQLVICRAQQQLWSPLPQPTCATRALLVPCIPDLVLLAEVCTQSTVLSTIRGDAQVLHTGGAAKYRNLVLHGRIDAHGILAAGHHRRDGLPEGRRQHLRRQAGDVRRDAFARQKGGKFIAEVVALQFQNGQVGNKAFKFTLDIASISRAVDEWSGRGAETQTCMR